VVSARSSPLVLAAERVRALLASYEPPDFAHVPDPDAAIFLCAVDHKTGYSESHSVDGEDLAGSELMWVLGLRSAAREPGLLTPGRLREVSGEDIAGWFEVGGETVGDPGRRASLWTDLAVGLIRDHDGSAQTLLDASGGRLAGRNGLVSQLARYEAYLDPLAKKAFLFAKICERRGWLAVRDPDSWEVAADNVLMRLALRSGLVEPGPLVDVRSATRVAMKALAATAEISPPILDDMLWELGRNNPDLLGREAGELTEPPRNPESAWY
jgi:hypothetical protein